MSLITVTDKQLYALADEIAYSDRLIFAREYLRLSNVVIDNIHEINMPSYERVHTALRLWSERLDSNTIRRLKEKIDDAVKTGMIDRSAKKVLIRYQDDSGKNT